MRSTRSSHHTAVENSPVVELRFAHVGQPHLVAVRHATLANDLQIREVIGHANEPHVPVLLCARERETDSFYERKLV